MPWSRRLFLPVLGLIAFATAWWLSSIKMRLDIDWDNAAHLYSLDRGLSSTEGYTAHIALIPLYGLGARLAHLFGGGNLEGIRLVNALAVAVAVMFLGATLRALGVGLAATVVICL